MALYLTIDHLKHLVGSKKVEQLFDDDLSSSIDAGFETDAVTTILDMAESVASSKLLRRYTSNDQIVALANADSGFITHVAYIALELASERRSEFLSNDGKGEYWVQYERAVTYLDDLSKSKIRSVGESEAGTGARVGGTVKPQLQTGTPRFVFAPDDDFPTGHGGF